MRQVNGGYAGCTVAACSWSGFWIMLFRLPCESGPWYWTCEHLYSLSSSKVAMSSFMFGLKIEFCLDENLITFAFLFQVGTKTLKILFLNPSKNVWKD